MDQLREILCLVFIFIGVILMVISSIGIIRLPDFYVRMSAITKAATLGVGFIVIGIAIYFNEVVIMNKSLAILLFILFTSPIAAHAIARAAFKNKVPFWKKTLIDEFKPYLREHGALQETDVKKPDRDKEGNSGKQ